MCKKRAGRAGVLMSALCLMICAVTAFCMTGCNSFVTVGSVTNSSATKWSMTYSLLNGGKSKKITLKEDKTMEIAVTHTAGTFKLKVEKEDGTVLSEITESDENFTQSLPLTAGKYKLSFEGVDHKGGFSFSWA